MEPHRTRASQRTTEVSADVVPCEEEEEEEDEWNEDEDEEDEDEEEYEDDDSEDEDVTGTASEEGKRRGEGGRSGCPIPFTPHPTHS